jgi:hypothetical protein
MKRLRLLVGNNWRPALAAIGAVGLLIVMLWFRLGELPGGISEAEAVTREHLLRQDVGSGNILANPLYLPHSIALFILQQFGVTSLGAVRSISALIGLGTIIAFYLLVRKWHTNRMAVFGTLLFASSAWFLHIARYGSTDILFTILIIFLFAGVWLQHSRHRAALLSLLLFCGAMTLYIPGMIWFVALGAIWQRKRIAAELRGVSSGFIISWILLGLLLVAPLAWALTQDFSLWRPVLGLPDKLPAITEFLRNLATIPVRLFVQGPDDPAVWLGRLPLLDFFSSVMAIIGVYWYLRRIRLDRTIFIIAVFLIGSILMALDGPVRLAFLLPFVYLLVTAGLTFMLQQWFTVFPRNPIARTVGATLLSIGVLITVFYHVTHYYIAWPNTPATREEYKQLP